MPRYYCDYCDAYLTHDSAVVRKQHNSGYKHKSNVKAYYLQFDEENQARLHAELNGFPPGPATGVPGMGMPPPPHMLIPPRPGMPMPPAPFPGARPFPRGMPFPPGPRMPPGQPPYSNAGPQGQPPYNRSSGPGIVEPRPPN